MIGGPERSVASFFCAGLARAPRRFNLRPPVRLHRIRIMTKYRDLPFEPAQRVVTRWLTRVTRAGGAGGEGAGLTLTLRSPRSQLRLDTVTCTARKVCRWAVRVRRAAGVHAKDAPSARRLSTSATNRSRPELEATTVGSARAAEIAHRCPFHAPSSTNAVPRCPSIRAEALCPGPRWLNVRAVVSRPPF